MKTQMNTPVKILIIDDDDVDRQILKRALSACGLDCRVVEFDDISHIADLKSLGGFDCIFLDYLLPGNNGLSFLKKIREHGVAAPVVIVTSQGSESIAVDLMKSGASDYIVKNDITGAFIGRTLQTIMRTNQVVKAKEEAERALRESEARLAEAQRIAKIGNWEYDVRNGSVCGSPVAYEILNLPRGSALRVEQVRSVVHPEDLSGFSAAWQECLLGKNVNIDFRITAEGTLRYANLQGYAVFNERQEPVRLFGIIQDISSRKLAEQELSKAVQLAETSLKVKETFLANMSHEIRTPMNAILGFTRLLYDSPLTAEQKGFIDAIHFSGENLLVIINDILDLSKIRSGRLVLEKSDFNLAEVIAGIIAVLVPRAVEKGLTLKHKIASDVPLLLKGDPVRLNQILTNLIANGIKFTEKGSVMLEINLRSTTKQHAEIEFIVRDTGIGIPADKHSVIFESFVQASGETTRKYGGTGLGLAIVKSLVDIHNGQISLASEPGQGSTFSVVLPFEQVSNQMALQHGGHSADDNDGLAGIEVLVVDDNAVNQLLVKKVLEKAGCRIDLASNGKEALACARAKSYDVILMDVQMPEMDGYETTRHIRNDFPASVASTPIIAMTAHAFGSHVTRCMEEGMNDYISKPFRPAELYDKIKKHLAAVKSNVVFLSHTLTEGQPIDLSGIYKLGKEDSSFLASLIDVYDKQTPVFVEKLKLYSRSQNFEAIGGTCNQIRSSYAILKVAALEKALNQISGLLQTEPEKEAARIALLINDITSFISAINEQLKRGLRKTG